MIRNLFALILCGLSMGWMMGMAVTPVVKDVLVALLGVATALLLALSGLSRGDQPAGSGGLATRFRSFDALPLGLFLVFLALGSAAGVLTRSNAVLGPGHRWLSERWELDSVQQRRFRYQLLSATYNLPDSAGKPTPSLPVSAGSTLFSQKVREFCARTQTMNGIELQDQLEKQLDMLREQKKFKFSDYQLALWQTQLANKPAEADLQRIRTALCDTP